MQEKARRRREGELGEGKRRSPGSPLSVRPPLPRLASAPARLSPRKPMSLPSKEMLIGACAAHGLDRTGTQEELRRRLGDHLVSQLLFGTHVGPKRPLYSPPRASSAATDNNKRPATAWHAFQRAEKERVKAAGFHGRVAIVQETARRWKLHKQVGTSNAPLMLGHSSDEASSEADSVPDGLVVAIADLSPEELSHALHARGIEDAGDRDANVAALARAMVA